MPGKARRGSTRVSGLGRGRAKKVQNETKSTSSRSRSRSLSPGQDSHVLTAEECAPAPSVSPAQPTATGPSPAKLQTPKTKFIQQQRRGARSRESSAEKVDLDASKESVDSNLSKKSSVSAKDVNISQKDSLNVSTESLTAKRGDRRKNRSIDDEFDSGEEDLLLEWLKQNPWLYSKDQKQFKDKRKREQAWSDKATEVSLSHNLYFYVFLFLFWHKIFSLYLYNQKLNVFKITIGQSVELNLKL